MLSSELVSKLTKARIPPSRLAFGIVFEASIGLPEPCCAIQGPP